MAAAQQLVTNAFKLHDAQLVVSSITDSPNTAYYVFFGNHIPYSNVSSIPTPVNNTDDLDIVLYRNMIFGKRVTSDDVTLMITRNDYQTDAVYTPYDDQLDITSTNNYYVTVNAGAFYHTFKCLDNNGGANSIIEPNFADINIGDIVYQTSDGYIWKYMYSITDTVEAKFATELYFPLTSNTIVVDAAIGGGIEVVKVVLPGKGYNNYTNGSFTINDLRVGDSPIKYSLNQSLNASAVDNFYTDCYLTIISGTGVGQSLKVVGYTVNSTYKTVVLERGFNTPPQNDSVYEVNPGVNIIGDGQETVTAFGRAIVNAVGNTIQSIEMIEIGADYNFATANILATNVVGVVNNAILRPILLPHGGHGANPALELDVIGLGISIKVSNTDVDIPLTNDYRTIGLLKDPLFSETTINFNNSNGVLFGGERFYKIDPILINTNTTLTLSSSNVSTDIADFQNQLSPGVFVYFKGTNKHQIATVNSIVNSSFFTIASPGLFTGTANLYLAGIDQPISNIGLTTTVLTGTVSINTISPNIIGTSTVFTNELVGNTSLVFFYGNTVGGGEVRKITRVVDNTHAVMDANASFVNATAHGIRIDASIHTDTKHQLIQPTGWVTDVTISSFVATNVSATLVTGDVLIGANTGGKVEVVSIARSGITKGFDTFREMYKYTGSVQSGSFIEDETVYQTALNIANASLHSVTNTSTVFYVTNQLGIFDIGNTIIGNDSGAVATISGVYTPEIVFGSGTVLYLENLDAITRFDNTTDKIKMVFLL